MSLLHSTNKQLIGILVFLSLLSIFANNLLFDKIVVTIILAVCLILGSREKCFVNPYNLFCLTPISLLIYYNFGDVYMVNLTHKTYLLGIINMTAFISALNYTKDFSNISNCIGVKSNRALIINTFILLTLGLSASFIPPLQSILWIFSYAGFVCAIKTKKTTMYLVVIALFLLSALSGSASKTSMLTFAVVLLFCYDKYFATTEKQKKRVKYLTILGVIFMIFSFSFANKDRGSYNADEGVELYSSRGMEWNYATSMFMPYMYITNGWTNLQYITETQDTRTYGLWLIKPLLGYIQVKDEFEKEYEMIPYSSFNTKTFIACGFKDFGYWLSIISSIFLGIFVKKIYSRFLISRSPFDIACYALVGLATLEMFFSNHFFMQSYPFTVVILMEIYKRICGSKEIEIE